MDTISDLNLLKDQILGLKNAAETLQQTGQRFPALQRNLARVLASIKMLELNFVDVLETEIDA